MKVKFNFKYNISLIIFRTGVKRVLDGSLQLIGREGEGRVIVKYSSLPVPYDTEYSVLDTDYDNYAVMWSCSGIGPVHTRKLNNSTL